MKDLFRRRRSPSAPRPSRRNPLPPPLHAGAPSRTQRRHQTHRRIRRLVTISAIVLNKSVIAASNYDMKIVIPGGTGQVGHILARHFHAQGHDVTVLTAHRNQLHGASFPGTASPSAPGSPSSTKPTSASTSPAAPSTAATTPPTARAILTRASTPPASSAKPSPRSKHPPAVWLNASTATIYRHALDRPNDEATGILGGDEPGAPDTWNFSIHVAKAWEAGLLRSTHSWHPQGRPALRNDLQPRSRRRLRRLPLAGPSRSWRHHSPGDQYVSWIHDADFIRAIEFLIASPYISGVSQPCLP